MADGYPIDAALAEARKTLFTQGNRDEWGTPVLYMRAPDGKLFDLEPLAGIGVMMKPLQNAIGVLLPRIHGVETLVPVHSSQ